MLNKVFIGYDGREDIAAHVCEYSIRSRTSSPLDITFLKSSDIPEYKRIIAEPQSTDFTFTRFWVPYLSEYKGTSIFVDCDFLFLDDIQKLIDIADNQTPVSVCKLDPYTPKSNVKMDNVPQHRSYRKNWASLMVFRNDLCTMLTPEYLNNEVPGINLHHFTWTDSIGELPLSWNTLDGYNTTQNPSAIHYTDGGPWFPQYQNTYYSQLWKDELDRYRKSG